jgi:alpha-galactosidase
MGVRWTEIGYPATIKATARDLWVKKDMGVFTKEHTVEVPSHGVVMLRIVSE